MSFPFGIAWVSEEEPTASAPAAAQMCGNVRAQHRLSRPVLMGLLEGLLRGSGEERAMESLWLVGVLHVLSDHLWALFPTSSSCFWFFLQVSEVLYL